MLDENKVKPDPTSSNIGQHYPTQCSNEVNNVRCCCLKFSSNIAQPRSQGLFENAEKGISKKAMGTRLNIVPYLTLESFERLYNRPSYTCMSVTKFDLVFKSRIK
jgi:hypothetical protein